jgi:D-alanyl-D-alanine carboxypeptidase (penicillin-binding protein 5/6)
VTEISRSALSRRAALLSGGAVLLAGPAFAAHHRKPHAAQPSAKAAASGDEDVDTGGGAASVASPAATPLGPMDTVAREACILDFNTGATLMDKAADSPMTPSSLTKLMTAYLVFAALSAGRITLTQQLPVSEKAWRMGGSKMFVPYPGSVSVEDLIKGMVIQSGNDACIVLAEGISGSEDQFVARMNEMAGKLGLTHSHFINCTGWPDPGHVMSARDIAMVARDLIANFPQYYHFFNEKDFVFNGIKQGNRNTLVDKGIADGLKTGHTEEGGFGECSSAAQNGRRVIVVLNGMSSMSERAHETERLLEWALNSFEDVRLLTKDEPLGQVPVWLGTKPEVALVGGETKVLTLPLGWKTKARVEVEYDAPLRAPVRKGDQIGRMVVAGDGMPAMELALVAADSVPRVGLPMRVMRVMAHYVTGV